MIVRSRSDAVIMWLVICTWKGIEVHHIHSQWMLFKHLLTFSNCVLQLHHNPAHSPVLTYHLQYYRNDVPTAPPMIKRSFVSVLWSRTNQWENLHRVNYHASSFRKNLLSGIFHMLCCFCVFEVLKIFLLWFTIKLYSIQVKTVHTYFSRTKIFHFHVKNVL